MKKYMVFLSVFCLSVMIFAEEVVPFPNLVKPDSITIDGSRIYISDDIQVCIYRLDDFSLEKRFGQQGEGPREFMRNRQTGMPPLSIDVQTDHLMVNSMNKISFFTKQGRFIEERKVLDRGDKFLPLGKGFVGEGDRREATSRYITVNLYDPSLNKVKEIFKVLHPLQQIGSGFKMINAPRTFHTSHNRLFVAMESDFIIRVFDLQGNPLYQIEHEFSKKKITDDEKKRVIKYVQNHPRFKELYPILKPLRFPQYYPAIRSFKMGDNRIYVVTWIQRDQKTECVILETKGKVTKRVYIPLKYVDDLEIYPFTFKGSRLYQLVENEDEEWELHITDISQAGV
jgi:hypothetical protein